MSQQTGKVWKRSKASFDGRIAFVQTLVMILIFKSNSLWSMRTND